MKKTLLTVGSITSIVAPVVAVVSCGDDEKDTSKSLYSEALKFGIAQMSSKDAPALAAALGSKTTATAAELGLDMTKIGLAQKVEATYSFAQYKGTGPIHVHFVLKEGTEEVSRNSGTFNLIPFVATQQTANMASEVGKLVSAFSTKNEATLASDLGVKTTVTLADLGYTPTTALSAGVTGIFTIAQYTGHGAILVKAVLSKTGFDAAHTVNNVWTFTVTPKGLTPPVIVDLINEKIKFGDRTSTKYESDLITDLTGVTHPTPAQLGFTPPADLASGVTVQYTITPYTNGNITVNFVLTQGADQVINNKGSFVIRPKAKPAPTISASLKAAVDTALHSVNSSIEAVDFAKLPVQPSYTPAELGMSQTAINAVQAALATDPGVTIKYVKNAVWAQTDAHFEVAYILEKPGAANLSGAMTIIPAPPVISPAIQTAIDTILQAAYSTQGSVELAKNDGKTSASIALDQETKDKINAELRKGQPGMQIKYVPNGSWLATAATFQTDYKIELTGAVTLTGTFTLHAAKDLSAAKTLIEGKTFTSTVKALDIVTLMNAANAANAPASDQLTITSLGVQAFPALPTGVTAKLKITNYTGGGNVTVTYVLEDAGPEHEIHNTGFFT